MSDAGDFSSADTEPRGTRQVGDVLLAMRRRLFPSRATTRYMVVSFLGRFTLVLILLVIILQMLDALNRSDDILAAEGATRAQLLRYIELRLPELISQFIPFAALLGSLFTLAGLAQHSEITIMRASGMAPAQIILPIMVATLVIGGLHLLFHDRITVPNSAALSYWASQDYALRSAEPPDGRRELWFDDNGMIVEVAAARKVGDSSSQILLDDLYLYRQGPDGLLQILSAAEFAIYDQGRWTLYGIRRFSVDGHAFQRIESEAWEFGTPISQIFAQVDRPDYETLANLSEASKTLSAAGLDDFEVRTALYHRFASVLASTLMPLLAAFVAFGVPRAGARVGRVVLGMAAGFSYFVFDNYMYAMGSIGILPPAMAAFGPLLLYTLLGLSILIRLD